ncbi:MAG TPA: hypothetical protein VGE07_16725, partial [Herpetosiphonaceae bacterium]
MTMTVLHQHHLFDNAALLWACGQATAAGVLLFEHTPRTQRAAWAAAILRVVVPLLPPDPAVAAVLAFASAPDAWGAGAEGNYPAAHHLVATIACSPARTPEAQMRQLAVAVGKVAYTAQQYPAPFDHAAGWEVVGHAWTLSTLLAHPGVERRLWRCAADPAVVTLTAPVRCHPSCPW